MNNQIQLHRFDRLTKDFAKSFVEYMNKYNDFSTNYKSLLQDLSKEQQEFLINVFSRIIFTHHSIVFTEKNFTKDEIEDQIKIREELLNKITQEGDYFKYKNYILPVNHFELSVFFYDLGIKYLKNIDKLKGKDFIDAGAYIGDSALILNQLSPKKIYAFEPVSEIFEKMVETVNLNNLNTVIEPVKSGLDEKSGESEIYINGPMSSAAQGQISNNAVKEKINITTIDEFVAKNNLNVGLIKIDTEGTELNILKGAENTIKSQKPTLIVGIYHNGQEFFEVKPLIESWNLGYKFRFAKFNPYSFFFETTLICET